VAGVAVVTLVVDNDSEIDGVPPDVDPDDVTENPIDPVASTPETVDWAIARSAPLDVELAGVICVVTVPVASLSAELGLNAPMPLPAVVNVTTWPPIGAPVASRTTPVSVAGVVAVTALDESERVIEGAPVVTPEPPGVT